MKKKWICCCCAIMLCAVLSGCAARKPPALSSPAAVQVSKKGDPSPLFSGSLGFRDNTLSVTVAAPNNAAGVRYQLSDDRCEISYQGMTGIFPSDAPKQDHPLLTLRAILSQLDHAAFVQTTKDGLDHFSLRTDRGEVSLTAKDGALLSAAPSVGQYSYSFSVGSD